MKFMGAGNSQQIILILADVLSEQCQIIERNLHPHKVLFSSIKNPLLNPHDILVWGIQKSEDLSFWPFIKQNLSPKTGVILVLPPKAEPAIIKTIPSHAMECLPYEGLTGRDLALAVHRTLERKRWESLPHSKNKGSLLVLTDPDTGLYHESYFNKRLEEEYQRSQRYHFDLSLVRFECDQLSCLKALKGPHEAKKILGLYGHQMARRIRSTDLLTITNDYSLNILLPHTTHKQAQNVSWRLLQEIKTQSIANSPIPLSFCSFVESLNKINPHSQTLDEASLAL